MRRLADNGRPKLLIIQAATYRSREDRRPHRIRRPKLGGAVMPYLAALAPPGWDIQLPDDEIDEPDSMRKSTSSPSRCAW